MSTVPATTSQITGGARRTSIQLLAEQLKPTEVKSGSKLSSATAISSSHINDESVVTSTTSTTVIPPGTPEPEPVSTSDTIPTSSPVDNVVNGSQCKNDGEKTDIDTTVSGTSFTTEGHENNGTTTPSPSSLIDHVIPRLADNPNPSCCDNVDPTLWGPQEVVTFLNINECGAHSELFQKNVSTGMY